MRLWNMPSQLSGFSAAALQSPSHSHSESQTTGQRETQNTYRSTEDSGAGRGNECGGPCTLPGGSAASLP